MLRIERVLPEEIATLQQIVEQTYLPYFRYLWHDEGQAYLAKINNREVLQRHLSKPARAYYFARLEDGTIAGYLKLIDSAPIPDTPFQQAMCLDKLYLTEAARGKGIGRALMEFADEQATLQGADYLWLRVMDSNAYNLDFYIKNGYKILCKRWLDLANIKESHRGIFTMLKRLS